MSYAINRFPICATFYYRIALKLGYSEEEAKSLGLARAIFFAYSKSKSAGSWGRRKKTYRRPSRTEEIKQKPNFDIINFAGLETYILRENGKIVAIVGDQKQTPEKFDKNVARKFEWSIKEGAFKVVCRLIDERIKDYSVQELNSGTAYKLYKKYRDELRERSLYEEE